MGGDKLFFLEWVVAVMDLVGDVMDVVGERG